MKPRNSVSGQYCKSLFELVLHDKPNVAFQIITYSENQQDLICQAENLNNLFAQSGKADHFFAEVYESNN